MQDSLWLCLYFPRLALDIFELREETHAIAIIEQRRVHCANRDNLSVGLSIATAQALYPDLLALERKPEHERDRLQQLAHWAYQFVAGVVIANHNSLLLEIGSCRRLHRGAHNLMKKLQRSLQRRGQSARFGVARTPKAAWLLAQCDCAPALQDDDVNDESLDAQLAIIPVDVLEIASEHCDALQKMGLTTLGALRDLPDAALGKRFGADFIDYLQKVFGAKSDPQLFFVPAPRFQHGLAFIDGVPQREMLLFPMKRLLQMLGDYLRARQLHCHTLHWQLFDAHRAQAEFSIELSRMQHRWHDLLELSRLKLEQIVLPGAVFGIHLRCENFFEAAPAPQQLFPDESDQKEAASALRDRLQARMGKDALQRIAMCESHWPELAWKTFLDSRRVVANDKAERPAAHPIRPLYLLPNPQPLSHNNDRPYWSTPLTLLRGPERIGNHWWQEENSERDYYIARNEHGVVCWIFHERETQRWFLHGLFA